MMPVETQDSSKVAPMTDSDQKKDQQVESSKPVESKTEPQASSSSDSKADKKVETPSSSVEEKKDKPVEAATAVSDDKTKDKPASASSASDEKKAKPTEEAPSVKAEKKEPEAQVSSPAPEQKKDKPTEVVAPADLTKEKPVEASASGDVNKPKSKTIDPGQAHVLVVEDNVPNFVLIARMLAYMGVQRCEWKTSGWQVVEFADTLPRIDLILMDIRLPYEDGFQALGKVRSHPRLKETLVVAVTAEASVEQMKRAKESGFDGFLGKPLDPDRFPDQIKRVLNGEAVWEMH
jgi:two-component system cell cycle response regulator DivK